jgi:NAD(P)-dependent dehydrogenase (short-subunit alcohol dehydrogenase family)
MGDSDDTRDGLEGQVAIVTGSGRRSGIGYGIARHLARLGVSVVVTDLCRRSVPDEQFETAAWAELVGIAEELEQFGGRHLAVRANVTSPDEVQELLDSTEDTFGRIDILVNNAGVFVVKPLMDTTIEEWNLTMQVNALGPFLCSTAAAQRMIAKGIKGRIVNLSSISGKEGWPSFGAYTASKFAVIGLTQTLARELAPYDIRVNAVCPGLIMTSMHSDSLQPLSTLQDSTPKQVEADQLSRVPMGRFGEPEDVARVVGFLVSPDSDYMTGQALNVSGGLMVSH